MGKLEFLMTPSQKADHVAANFGHDSLYARSMRLLAKIAGEHPSEERLNQAISIVERQIEEYREEFRPQS